MCRQKNRKALTIWAMVEGLSQIARGIPRIANHASVMRRYSLTYPTIFRKLMAMVPSVRESNRQLLQSEVCLDTGFDNFQLFVNKNFQRNGTRIHATCRLAKRSIPIIPSNVNVLQKDGLRYHVLAILQFSTYASLIRIQLVNHYNRRLLLWPSMGWTIVYLHGIESQSNSID